METTSFGAWMQRRRKALDLTQQQLAQRVGCAQGTIRKIEADERRPSKQLAELLADHLAIPPVERVAFLLAARAELAVDRLAAPTPLADQAAGVPSALPTGTITFVFTDIEGSTRLWEQHPQAMAVALAQHDSIVREAIGACGGVVFHTAGDAVCAAFQNAADALRAALDAQHALHSAAWGPTGPLRVRMALHTGVVERAGADYLGLPLSRVARLLAAAHGGQTLLSRVTAELVREHLPPEVTLRDMGTHRLKDLTHPEQIFQLVAADLPADFPPLRTLSAYRTNLPAQPTALLGRDAEVRTVADLLRRGDVRLLTLTGPGGVGKTRLALQVASELLDAFADGIWFINLAPISDPTLVIPTIAQMLDVKEGGGQPLPDTLKASLRTKQVLLLLDNFEQVVTAAPQVAELLAAAPQLKVLVSSRAVLHLYGEYEFIVPPLALPSSHQLPPLSQLAQYPAVQLFLARAQAVKADFALTEDNAPAVAAICRQLDGLPLAIELAAARSKLFTPQVLLTRLAHRLNVLTGGARDVPARQQTLRDAIDWSYHLLSPDEQTLFRRLGVFVGGCSLEAVEAVCTVKGDLGFEVLDGLAALVDKSLLRQMEGTDGEPRFVMLETIREYTLEQLTAAGEVDTVQRRHAEYYVTLAEQAEPALRGPRQRAWLDRLESEHDNLRAVLDWSKLEVSRVETGLRLGGALYLFWMAQGYLSEGRAHLTELLALLEAAPPTAARTTIQATALMAAGNIADLQGDYVVARPLLEQSLALFRILGDKEGIARVLDLLGWVAFHQGDSPAALFEESLAVAQEIKSQGGVARALWNLGTLAGMQGDQGRAAPFYAESLALYRALGDKAGMAWSLNTLGVMAQIQADYGRAASLYAESLALFQELGDNAGIATVRGNQGHLAQHQGDYTRAVACLAETLAFDHARGHKEGIAEGLARLALVANATGHPRRAARLLGAAIGLYEAIGVLIALDYRAEYERTLAAVRAHLGEEAFVTAWAEGQAMSLEQAVAYALSGDDRGAELPQQGHTANITLSLCG